VNLNLLLRGPQAAAIAKSELCTSVFVHSCGPASIRYTCTLPAPHPGQLHEHRPRPDRMAVAQWT
jgi:hypothetical protein